MSLISPLSPLIKKAEEPVSTQKREPQLQEDSREFILEPTWVAMAPETWIYLTFHIPMEKQSDEFL